MGCGASVASAAQAAPAVSVRCGECEQMLPLPYACISLQSVHFSHSAKACWALARKQTLSQASTNGTLDELECSPELKGFFTSKGIKPATATRLIGDLGVDKPEHLTLLQEADVKALQLPRVQEVIVLGCLSASKSGGQTSIDTGGSQAVEKSNDNDESVNTQDPGSALKQLSHDSKKLTV
jgi:hypothetical protein